MGYLEANFRIFIYFDLKCVKRDSGGTVGVLLKPNRWLSRKDLATLGAYNSELNTRIKQKDIKEKKKIDNIINNDLNDEPTTSRSSSRACKKNINYHE